MWMRVPRAITSCWTATAVGAQPHVLPVPLPAQRRNIDSDYEHLAATLRCTVREWGSTVYDGTSKLAGLEIGSRPA